MATNLTPASVTNGTGIGDQRRTYTRRQLVTNDGTRKFASIHASVHNHFYQERTLSSWTLFKLTRAVALAEWRDLCAA